MIQYKGNIGEWKIYEDKDCPRTMGFKGFEHPHTQEEVLPCIKQLVKGALEHLNKQEGDTVSKQETIGFLETLLGCTEPEVGCYYCPNLPPQNAEILTRYGKKLAAIESLPGLEQRP